MSGYHSHPPSSLYLFPYNSLPHLKIVHGVPPHHWANIASKPAAATTCPPFKRTAASKDSLVDFLTSFLREAIVYAAWTSHVTPGTLCQDGHNFSLIFRGYHFQHFRSPIHDTPAGFHKHPPCISLKGGIDFSCMVCPITYLSACK